MRYNISKGALGECNGLAVSCPRIGLLRLSAFDRIEAVGNKAEAFRGLLPRLSRLSVCIDPSPMSRVRPLIAARNIQPFVPEDVTRKQRPPPSEW